MWSDLSSTPLHTHLGGAGSYVPPVEYEGAEWSEGPISTVHLTFSSLER